MNEINIVLTAPELVEALHKLIAALQRERNKTTVEESLTAEVVQNAAKEPAYDLEQIMTAGAALIDEGKMNELLQLLSRFGVQAVSQLRPEQVDSFVGELRTMGAQI